jgi:hypothetical protein
MGTMDSPFGRIFRIYMKYMFINSLIRPQKESVKLIRRGHVNGRG